MVLILNQPVDLVFLNRIQQLGQEAGDAVLLGGVLIRCAVRAFGIALGLLLPDQFVVDALGRIVIDRRLGFGARVHRRPPTAIGEVDDESFASGLNGGLIHLVA